ncbi:unnamed protein product [Urochloa decumbens]|uniref:Uncharacterized protein n=1 Tax=Urochloa decumbens TaxID=240449 RepID=A0ABC9AQ19_9POAL
MARLVHYMMATSFVILVMMSSNLPSCKACFGRWCRPPCFQPEGNLCTDARCRRVCEDNGYPTNRATCNEPKKGRSEFLCCCPKPRWVG